MTAGTNGSTLQEVVRFLDDELGLAPERYTLTTPLFSSGLLDSFALMALLSFAEQQFGVVVTPDDLTPQTVDNVQAFVAFIEERAVGGRHEG
jgi:acyl carrier protein